MVDLTTLAMDQQSVSSNPSALFNKTATSPPPPSEPQFDHARYIYFYGLAVILPVGLLCNMLCFAVFLSSRSLRRTTTGHYLTALAVADTIFLLGELFRWLNSFDSEGQILGIDFMETITFWCRTTFFLRYAGKLASAWITVIISGERFITVAYPLQAARISTPTIAKLTIFLTFCVCAGLGAFPYWTIGLKMFSNRTICGLTDQEEYEVWSMTVLRVGSLFLPSAVIFIFTILIIVFLRKAQKFRAQNREGEQTGNTDFQLTAMLISVAIAFLILRLPYTVSFYLITHKRKFWNPIDPWFSYRIYLANKICDLIAISNYAVNFFLYCFCANSFRKKFWRLVTCAKPTYDRRASTTTQNSIQMNTFS